MGSAWPLGGIGRGVPLAGVVSPPLRLRVGRVLALAATNRAPPHAAGLVHRSRGRPSHRRVPPALEQAREALRADYRGCGPTLAAQKLHERQGIKLSQETVPRLPLSFVRISAVALPVQRAPRPGGVRVCAGVNAVRTDLHERLAVGAPLPGREFFNAHGNMGQKWYNAG